MAAQDNSPSPSKVQSALSLGAALAASSVATKLANSVWKMGSGGKAAPTNPADPETQAREAMVWAMLSGATVGVARMWLQRRLTRKDRHAARVQNALKA